MRTKNIKKLPRFKYIVSLFAIMLILFAIGCNQTEKKENLDLSIELSPGSNSELWGYQMLSVNYDARRELAVKNIVVSSELGEESLITDDNILYSEPGLFEIILCAECIEVSEISITIEFEENQDPITQSYKINHMPIAQVVGEVGDEQLILDASASEDPEGQPLTFKWEYNDTAVTGSNIMIDPTLISDEPVLLKISDGVTTIDDIISYDPLTRRVTLTKDSLKCTDLTIATTNKSALNPEIPLGAYPPVGTQLSVNAAKKLTKSYRLGHAFEVKAIIVPHGAVLDEGQDVARSSNLKANDPKKKIDKTGKRRKKDDRSTYEKERKTAGFPNPLPAANSHPPMVADNYDHHPLNGFADKNTGTGVQRFMVKAKGLHKEAKTNKMIWFDQPGLVLRSGTDVSKGIYYKAYFRSWMKPSIPPCQKFYIVEIEVDANGKVIKNNLTMR